jgi:hypothetical protein
MVTAWEFHGNTMGILREYYGKPWGEYYGNSMEYSGNTIGNHRGEYCGNTMGIL